MSVLMPPANTRGSLVVVHGVSARSAARRRHKQWKQQRREQQAWQNVTEQLAVQYQIVVPPPEHLLTSPPQVFEPEPVQDYGQDVFAARPVLQGSQSQPTPPRQQQQQRQQQHKQQQQQQRQAGVPGPVRGPSAPAGALWVEHRRSAAEQQQYRLQRRRQQQARAKPQLQKTHDLQDLLATTEQIQHLQNEGLRGVAAAAAARASAGRQRIQQQQRGRPTAAQQQQQQQQQAKDMGENAAWQSQPSHVPVLSTDLLWQQAYELQKAQSRHCFRNQPL